MSLLVRVEVEPNHTFIQLSPLHFQLSCLLLLSFSKPSPPLVGLTIFIVMVLNGVLNTPHPLFFLKLWDLHRNCKDCGQFFLKWDDQVEKQVISIYGIGSELNSSTIPPLSSWSIVIGGVWIVSILPSQVIKIEVQ